MNETIEKTWQEKVAEQADSKTADIPLQNISPEEFFAAMQAQMELEEAAEAAIADDSKELFEHLFGKDDELDALMAAAQKEVGMMFEEMFAEAKAE